MKQKGFSQLILMVIVGAIVIVAGGGTWYYQKKDVPKNESALETQATPDSSSGEVSTPTGQTNQNAVPKTPTQKEVVKTQTRDDFGCWPPSCSVIPDPQGRKSCEDWKAGKAVQWPSCNYFSDQP